jgi:hypothetical protein
MKSQITQGLLAAGKCQCDLARAVGLSEAEVSRQLHGIRPLSPRVEAAARRLILQGRRDLAHRGLLAALELLERPP